MGRVARAKQTFLLKILKNVESLIQPIPKNILYCYSEFHQHIPEIESIGIITHMSIPSEEMLDQISKPALLIMDDLMTVANEKFLVNLFTKKSHHKNISVIFVTQNMFEKSLKTPRNNSQYLIIMRSPNSALSVRNIGTQLFPQNLPYFLDAYNQATANPYGYLLIDMHAASQNILRLRTNIFPDDEKVLFINKNG